MKVFALVFLHRVLAVYSRKCSNSLLTELDRYFKNHAYKTKVCADVRECLETCFTDERCYSVNFCLRTRSCEFNDASKELFPQDVITRKWFIHGFDSNKKQAKLQEVERSCSKIKSANNHAVNGYYPVQWHGNIIRTVFCDMERFGGGWTLVASISRTSKKHQYRRQVNCFNSTLCVPNPRSQFDVRKLADTDIHSLAHVEGIFRVDVRSGSYAPYTVFYRIPSGADKFNAGCKGYTRSCPRIVISHSHPYKWESNCRGIHVGYKIPRGQHTTFDNYDDGECGRGWRSSQRVKWRVMYGYLTSGIYNKRKGLLFVK